MASVIRIKRRRNDDPAEALLLSHKKSRYISDPNDLSENTSVLEFAGTLASKEEPISKHIKDAIRRKKIHKEMHPHSSDFKAAYRADMTSKLRKEKAESSQNSRYRITYSKRALDIDNLDFDLVESDSVNKNEASSQIAHNNASDRLSEEECSVVNKNGTETKSIKESSKTLEAHQEKDSAPNSVLKSEEETSVKKPIAFCDSECGPNKDEKVFCLIDVEHDKVTDQETKTAESEITMNGVPLNQVKNKVPISEESDDYVYDLYFTHTRLSDIQEEALVTVHALCNDFLHEDLQEENDDNVYDDEDDSNDESNWRNDYPDEDPYFFENEGRDYEYRNDMRESLFNGGDDDGDLLSYWMDTRCRVGDDCSDFEDEYERDKSVSEEEQNED